jgi:hypothetical protein
MRRNYRRKGKSEGTTRKKIEPTGCSKGIEKLKDKALDRTL